MTAETTRHGDPSEGERFRTFLAESGSTSHDIVMLLDDVRDYIAIHEPVFDEGGVLIDGRLLAWNRGYEGIRVEGVIWHQLIREKYYEPATAIESMQKAWDEGWAKQKFELTPGAHDRYRPEGAIVLINVLWRRMGNVIVEIGNDASENFKLQLQLLDEQSAAAESRRDRMLAEERERIARHLHDSVIQQLYATALGLRAVSLSANLENEREHVELIASSISGIIDEIRAEIFKVSAGSTLSLRDDLVQVVEPFALAVGARIDISLDGIENVDPELRSQIRAVVRESVSNSVRHGTASRIAVVLRKDKNDLVLTIEDNGLGLPVNIDRLSGLSNLSQRARDLGGSYEVVALETQGTKSIWRVPLPA
jgi:signal transduction histidine kinase